jgi:hypothetical protein
MPAPIGSDSIARTATGRVLYAAEGAADIALLPNCWAPREWRQLRESIRDPHATVIDHQEAFPGICCVSAPVWWPNGRCAGALTALVQSAKVPPSLPDLVSHMARRIAAQLGVTQPAHALSQVRTHGPDANRPFPRHSNPQPQLISLPAAAPNGVEKVFPAITASRRTCERSRCRGCDQ